MSKEQLSALLFKKKFKDLNYNESGIVYELVHSQRLELILIRVLDIPLKILNQFRKGIIARIENKFLKFDL